MTTSAVDRAGPLAYASRDVVLTCEDVGSVRTIVSAVPLPLAGVFLLANLTRSGWRLSLHDDVGKLELMREAVRFTHQVDATEIAEIVQQQRHVRVRLRGRRWDGLPLRSIACPNEAAARFVAERIRSWLHARRTRAIESSGPALRSEPA